MDTDNLLEEVRKAIAELLTLEIVTTVGDIGICLGNKKEIILTDLKPVASAVTRINIASGDIWTNRTPAENANGVDIGEYHAKMVETSQAVMERNIHFITEIIEKLRVKS